MLPFQSRIVDLNPEELNTDDVEVVHHARNAAKLAPSRGNLGSKVVQRAVQQRRYDRPQIPAPIPASTRSSASQSARLPAFTASSLPSSFQEMEEEMTCLMPAKMILPAPPSESEAAERASKLRPMSFRPAPQPMRVMAARQESFAHIPAPPPSLAPMAMPSVDTDPRFNPGATVLTSRSLAGRPTASWAAALVVMGIFAGLVTAAVARGDLGDSKVAAASQQPAVQQVIPSQQQMPAGSPLLSQTYTASAAPMAIGTPITTTEPVAAAVAVAAKIAPATHAAPRAAAPAPVAHASKPRVIDEPKEQPKEQKEIAAKPKKEKKGDSDLASAKEAQALADAQLAASL